MIVVCRDRDTVEWRRAHRGRVSAADARAIMAADGTRARRDLVERIVLDREGIDQHTDEQPDPWRDAHEAALRSALVAYRRDVGPIEPAPLCASSELTWLLAAAHGTVDGGLVLFRCRSTLRAYAARAGRMDRAWRVRTQLVAFACEAAWIDVVDYLDGLGRVRDRLGIARVWADRPWLEATAFPRLVSLWAAVGTRLRERAAAPKVA